MTDRNRALRWVEGIILITILAVTFWLRWTALQSVSLHVDEYITLRAARQILDRGLPLLPTGNFYSHGLILSYIEAGVMALAGFNPALARVPVLIVSLLTLVLTWWVGRRWFSPPAGLLAAALLAVTPEAIVWGSRARMYAPLQFFVLLAVYFYWKSLTGDSNWRNSALFALFFLAAMFLHAETMLLLPVFVLIAAILAWPEFRQAGLAAVLGRWWRRGLIGAWLVAALGILAELWFRGLGPAMVSRLAEGVYGPSGRAYLRLAWDWSGIRKVLEPILVTPALLGLLALLLVGLGIQLFRRRQGGGTILPEGWTPVLIYLSSILGLSLLVLLFLTDPSWKSPRYLFMLVPVLYLVLAATIFGLWARPESQPRWQWLLLGVTLVWVAVGFGSAAWAAANEKVAGYDDAFEYLVDRWQPGDAVMTFVPQAALFYLGQVDYLSVPTDYRGFAVERDGRWLEGWDTIPMVDSAAGLSKALAAQDRLWFVVDEHRFNRRFPSGFTQAVWDGMDLVWRDNQVMVFRTAEPPAPVDFQPRRVVFGDQIALEGFALEAAARPGSDLPMTLYWSAMNVPTGIYSTFVHMVDADGTGWAQADGSPQGEVYPTAYWWPGNVIPDRKILSLPSELPGGLYRLDTGMYEAATGTHLATQDGRERVTLTFLRVGEPEDLPPNLVPLDAVFDDQIRLLGYTLTPTGDGASTLGLAWSADRQVDGDYTVFVHLVDDGGEIRSQDDAPPGGGFYPTSFWMAGEMVLDHHDLTLPANAPAGTYHLRVGLYQPETGLRLPTTTGDFVELQEWTIP